MPHKKYSDNPKKQVSVSQEEHEQVQQQLTAYRQIEATLQNSQTVEQAEEAITPITSMTEDAQILLLKELAKVKKTDAANVLLAVNTFAPIKEVRKEARRSLIRLEASRHHPQWIPPSPPISVLESEEDSLTEPGPFWKGRYTDTRDTGEIQLMLFWEQGKNNKDVRIFGFLLEFWSDGVKDFFTEVTTKRQIEKRMDDLNEQLGSIKLIECNFALGKSLVEEALAVNKKSGKKPHYDYTRNLSLVQKLLLDADNDAQEEDTTDNDNQLQSSQLDEIKSLFEQLMEMGLDPEEEVAYFLDSWLKGEYETAYSALASDSPIRAGLTVEEWAARRRAWAEQAHPSQGKSEIAYKHDEEEDEEDEEEEENVVSSVPPQETTDKPEAVEAFWSLALTDTEANKELPELPRATAVYKATGRHWFWAKYTLVREGKEWLIHSLIDAGAEALQLSPEELQEHLAEVAEQATEQLNLVEAEVEEDEEELENLEEIEEIEEIDDDDEDDDDIDDLEFEELAERFEEMIWITTRAMHYTDALIAQSPEDPSLYDMGYDQASAIQENERAASYIELQAERFPEHRGEALRKLAMAQINIARTYEENDDEERSLSFIAEAEKTLRDSIATDSAPMGSILLAETLLAQNKNLDEAEQLLQDALKQENIDPKEITLAEASLGKLAQGRSEHENALNHYQRAAEISPDFPSIWFNIGFMQRHLGRLEEAELNYQRSIDESPNETGAYAELAALYSDRGEFDEAEAILEEGLELNPEAVDLLAAMALLFINKGDMRQAKEFLEEAEDLDEEHELVQVVRQYYQVKQAEIKQERQQFRQKQKSRKPKRK